MSRKSAQAAAERPKHRPGRRRSTYARILGRPSAVLTLSFLTLILIGTAALRHLPLADGSTLTWLEAAFTATSAVCVTGLSITEGGAADLSLPGQLVLLALIQLGGLGVLTFGMLAAEFFRISVSLSSQAAVDEALLERRGRMPFMTALRRVLAVLLTCELIGAGVLFLQLEEDHSVAARAYQAIFLSISAFCNAGFSIYPESLVDERMTRSAAVTIALLIVVGGLGYGVVLEVVSRTVARLRGIRPKSVRWSLQTRLVLRMTLSLIIGGTLALWLLGIPFGHALFQSITARTAGFSTIGVDMLPVPVLMILIPLMFIGGSPGSCAGGIKTPTIAVWFARLSARLTGKGSVTLLDRSIPQDIVRRATLVIGLASVWCGFGILLLAITEPVGDDIRFEHLIFEQVSAFGTVGLSAGLTPDLSPTGKLWIMLSMFVGRVGPLTAALAVVQSQRSHMAFPTERVMVG